MGIEHRNAGTDEKPNVDIQGRSRNARTIRDATVATGRRVLQDGSQGSMGTPQTAARQYTQNGNVAHSQPATKVFIRSSTI